MRMGWLLTLVLVITVTMPPIAVGQAQPGGTRGADGNLLASRGMEPGGRPSAYSGRAPRMGGEVEA